MNLSIRAEKTTPNADDYKVLLVGVILCITGILVDVFGVRYYDMFLAKRPFVTATISIVDSPKHKRPLILYDADGSMPVDATWIAVIKDLEDKPLSYRRGTGAYNNKDDKPKHWTWNAFFENSRNSTVPTVPDEPFKICVRYLAITRDTLVHDESPEYCSKIHYPRL